uniref:DNA repair protein RecN n=1 Tax=Roseihalotalea indica TaxID=2867963 RepID=A0AA49GPE4_9BACT|nr:DNA repair protein RecN [Tunicatimonas sp. TK19036]
MLQSLTIKNYALLQELEMKPSENLNIITGETGAGKSIMLGAIGLLLGNRADKRSLYNEEKKCIIEGIFTINKFRLESIFDQEELDYDPICILRREIAPNGKSRAFVNDTPVRLETLRGIGHLLVDIHSQHDTLLLGDNLYQLELIDAFAANEQEQKSYFQSYQQYRRARQEYDRVTSEAARLRQEDDYNRFLLDELHKAKLQEGEQEILEESLKVMENAGNIQEQLSTIQTLFSYEDVSVDQLLAQAKQAIIKIASLSPKYDAIYQRIESCLIEIRDISGEVESEALEVDFDHEKVEATRDRLDLLFKLQQKHHVKSVQELLSLQWQLEEKVEQVTNLDSEISRLAEVKEVAYREMDEQAKRLTLSREATFVPFAQELARLLRNLGIPDAVVEVERTKVEPGESGADEISILFSANKGISPQELKGVASGGEFSRLMFCIKYILAGKTSLPTIIFDEIDTGVSGEIAIKMVNMMKEMSRSHQVMAISHLPQVAAKGDAHYFVYKDNSSAKVVSKIRQLSEEERVVEIAKMLGGNNPSTIAYENAKELLSF